MRRRDESEYSKFVAGVIRQLRRTAYLMCGDWHRAEDAAQDALVKVYVVWPKLTHRDGMTSYAHRAVVTAVLDQSRRPWRREHPEFDIAADHLPAAAAAPDAVGAVHDRMAAIEVLATLPPRQRACVVLRHYVDLSIEETADALGITPGAVKSQTSRGLAILRDALRAKDYEGTLR